MKRITTFGALLLFSALLLAEEWVGWIADRKCALAGKYAGDQHSACVEAGQPLVFVNEADKKIYTLTDPAKAKDFVGRKVLLSGEMKGDAIEVRNVQPVTQSN